MPKQVWVGIDCGKHGAIASIDNAGAVLSEFTPVITTRTRKRTRGTKGQLRYSITTNYDLAGMLAVLKKYGDMSKSGQTVVVSIEQQRQRPHDSKQVVFQIAYGQGLWEMACEASGLPIKKVLPSQWKPRYVEPGADKKASLIACKKLYKDHDLPLAKDEARAEALLIADYTMRQELQLDYPRELPEKTKSRRKQK